MNLMSFGVFGLMFLIFLGIVSNSSEQSLNNIQNQMFLINCPAPDYNGQWNSTNVTIDGFVVILNSSAGVDYDGEGTVFRCLITPLTPFPAFQVIMSNKNYTSTTLGFPSGWFVYAGDFIGSAFQKVNNLFTLLGFFVLPTNFNILGFTLSDIGGVALMAIISLYSLCYVAIGLMIYKLISPFSGAD